MSIKQSRLGFGAIAAGMVLGLGLWAGWAVYAPDSGQAGAAPGAVYALAPAEAQVLVEVNGEPLTRAEVESAVDALFGAELRKLPSSEQAALQDELESRVLDDLIARALLFQEAQSQKIPVSDEAVDGTLAQLTAGLPPGATVADLAEASGLTAASLRERVIESLQVETLLERQMQTISVPTDADVADFYNRNPALFAIPEQVDARHVLIAAKPDETPEVRETKRQTAEGIRAKLAADPADAFPAVAAAHSDCPSGANGGRLGPITRGEVIPAFEQAVFSQETGEIGPVVETEFGFHVIRVDARRPGATVPLEEAASFIAETLNQERRETALENLILSLKEQASIVYPPTEPA